MAKLKTWLKASRPRTLLLSFSGVLLGGFLAFNYLRPLSLSKGRPYLVIIFAALTAILLQVLSNLANDYGDFKKGTDSVRRVGPQREMQSGAITEKEMRRGLAVTAALCLVSGGLLIFVLAELTWKELAVFAVLGIGAVLAALFYTLGKRPYGYRGLGDLYCFLFFGWAAVAGTYYLATKTLDFSVLLPASAMGFLSNAVLNINNMRDYENDKASGKNSLVVKLGQKGAFVYHCLLIGGAFACLAVYLALHQAVWYSYLFLLLSILFIKDLVAIKKTNPERLDPFLGRQVKHSFLLVLVYGLLLSATAARAQDESIYQPVTQQEMATVYETVKTPYKYGMVVAPDDDSHMTDSPTVFRHQGRWYMTYIVFDGKGYETRLAVSDDLLHWETLGNLLSFRDKGWDCNQRAGYAALVDVEWGGDYDIEAFDGRYWMTYLGGAEEGYESRPLSIGMATTDQPTQAVEWQGMDRPVLSPLDSTAQWFERETQFKSTVFRDKERHFGCDFVMFYNAFGVNEANGLGAERIGIALSDDMVHWHRYEGNPVVAHEEEGTISGDAHIQKLGDLYVMFYFRAFTPTRPYKAFNTFACSRDLIHWYDWEGDDLVFPSEPYDARYAHKSYLIHWQGVTYHFYCAVDNEGHRGIAVATSREMLDE